MNDTTEARGKDGRGAGGGGRGSAKVADWGSGDWPAGAAGDGDGGGLAARGGLSCSYKSAATAVVWLVSSGSVC